MSATGTSWCSTTRQTGLREDEHGEEGGGSGQDEGEVRPQNAGQSLVTRPVLFSRMCEQCVADVSSSSNGRERSENSDKKNLPTEDNSFCKTEE